MNSKVKKLLSFIFVLTMFIGISAYGPDDVQAAGAAPHTLAGLQVNAGRVDAKGKEASLYDSSGNIIKVLDPISSNWENSFKFTDKSLTESVIISRTDFEEINTNGVKLKFSGSVDGEDYVYGGNDFRLTASDATLYAKSGQPGFDYKKYKLGNGPYSEYELEQLEQFYMFDNALIGDEFGAYSKKVFSFGSINALSVPYLKGKVDWIGEPAESVKLKTEYQYKTTYIASTPIKPFEDLTLQEKQKTVTASDNWEWIFLYSEDENSGKLDSNGVPEELWRVSELMKDSKYTFVSTDNGKDQSLVYHYMEGLPLEGYSMKYPDNVGYKMGEYTDPLKNVYEIKYRKDGVPEDEEDPEEDPETDLELDKEDHRKYMNGYPDGTFGPDNNITREETAQMFFNLLTKESKDKYKGSAMNFPDVNENAWSLEAISVLSKGNVINGYPDGTFRPENPITRAEFAKVAAKFEKLAKTDVNPFTDIAEHWAFETIKSAALKGWINGYPNNTFGPENYITRAEAVKLANGVLERDVKPENIPAEAKQWPDVPKEAWYYPEIIEATNSHDYERLQDGTEDWTLVK